MVLSKSMIMFQKYPQKDPKIERMFHVHFNYCHDRTGTRRDNHSDGERELEPDKAGDSHQEGF